jgi:signal peptidase I
MKFIKYLLLTVLLSAAATATDFEVVNLSNAALRSVETAKASHKGALEMRAIAETGSMAPTIDEDSIVLMEKCTWDEVKTGDIIAVTNYEQVYLHRVVKVKHSYMITRGDALCFDDPIKVIPVNFRGERAFATVNIKTGKVTLLR